MKKNIFLLFCLLLSKMQAQQSGTLDTTFARHGFSAVDKNTFESILAIALQPDGKIVAVGLTEESDLSMFAVLRYLPDGSLDPSFASNGVFQASYLVGANIAQAVALQPDGKILVAGYTNNPQAASNLTSQELVVMRLNANGTLDASFGAGGFVALNLGLDDKAVSVRPLSDGKILVAGTAFLNSSGTMFVTRLMSNGTVDISFGTNGISSIQIHTGLWNYCYAMTTQPDGKILLAGEGSNFAGANFALIRLNANGTYDTSFSGDGKATNSLSPTDDGAQAMLLMPNGKILLAGYANNAVGKPEIALTRFDPDGNIDFTFGIDGKMYIPMGVEYAAVADLCLTGSGDIIIAGTVKRPLSYFDFFLAKIKPNGSLDTNFGNQGITITDYKGHYDGISAAQILPDGNIIVAGTAVDPSNSISDFLLAKYWLQENSSTTDGMAAEPMASVYPNPTHERNIMLTYTLPEPSSVSLDLFSMKGEMLRSLSKLEQAAGQQQTPLMLPHGLAAGAYLIGLRVGEKQTFVKIIVH